MQRKELVMADHSASAIEAAASAASAALKGSLAGSAVAGAGMAVDSTTIALAGLVFTVASFLVNWYYRHREYQLKRAAFEREDRR